MSKEADFNVLMIGPRRAGKSSVLSAMLKSLEMLEQKTGLCFRADEDTQVVMREKLSDLEQLFVLHSGNPEVPFSTLLGQENGIEYSPFTSSAVPYRFKFFLSDKKGRHKKKNTYSVEFTDIPGEHMTSDLETAGNTVVDRFIKSNVIIVAIDSPALMEGKIKNGVGEFHKMVNIPSSVYNVISVSDCQMREKIKENQKAGPKMILFVPLKCEKYYHNGTMDEMKERVKQGYKETFSYLEGCPEYTVAIAPILTLGDIVFDHYGTTINAKGKERISVLGDERDDGLANMPEFPMYKIRNENCKVIKPLYCEQPLLYLGGYIMGMKKYLEKAEHEVKKRQQNKTLLGKTMAVVKHTVMYVLFGVFYLAFLGIMNIAKDKALMQCIESLCKNIKISGDGYEIIQDSLGIRKVVEAYVASV